MASSFAYCVHMSKACWSAVRKGWTLVTASACVWSIQTLSGATSTLRGKSKQSSSGLFSLGMTRTRGCDTAQNSLQIHLLIHCYLLFLKQNSQIMGRIQRFLEKFTVIFTVIRVGLREAGPKDRFDYQGRGSVFFLRVSCRSQLLSK
jgi:hypothetical protein